MPIKRGNIDEKACLECGNPLSPGREDRKFCNDLCRTAFNNRKRKEVIPASINSTHELERFQKVYQIILANRNILMLHDLYVEEPYPLRDLLGHGFNLKYYTSECDMEEVGTFKFCFDYGYRINKDERVYIWERHEETFC